MGHLNGILARVGGNLNNNFRKSQMPGGLPGGGMLKLRFNRYIILVTGRDQETVKWEKKRNFIPKQNTHDLLVGTLSIGIPSL